MAAWIRIHSLCGAFPANLDTRSHWTSNGHAVGAEHSWNQVEELETSTRTNRKQTRHPLRDNGNSEYAASGNGQLRSEICAMCASGEVRIRGLSRAARSLHRGERPTFVESSLTQIYV